MTPDEKVRRDIARLQQGSPGLHQVLLQLMREANNEAITALQDILRDQDTTTDCTPADATLSPTIVRLLHNSGAATHLNPESIANALKTILRPAYEQDPKRTTELAKRLFQQQRGYLRHICKQVHEHYVLTRLLEGYLEDTDATESNGVSTKGRESGSST